MVRRDCDLRMERLSATAAGLRSPDDLLAALAGSLVEMIEESPEFFAILLELHSSGATTRRSRPRSPSCTAASAGTWR